MAPHMSAYLSQSRDKAQGPLPSPCPASPTPELAKMVYSPELRELGQGDP